MVGGLGCKGAMHPKSILFGLKGTYIGTLGHMDAYRDLNLNESSQILGRVDGSQGPSYRNR